MSRTAALGALVAVTGCGGGSKPGASADPARAAFAVVTVNPKGDQRAGVDVLRQGLGLNEAGRSILQQIARLRVRAFGVDAARVEETWAGDRVGFFLSSTRGGARGFVVPIRDHAKARDDLAALAADASPRTERYRGVEVTRARVSFPLLGDEVALAIVDGFAVVADPPGVQAAIDAVRGASLAESREYRVVRDAAAPGALAVGSINGFSLSLSIAKERVTLDGRNAPRVRGLGAALVKGLRLDGGKLLERLPGDSAVAFAVSGIGGALGTIRDAVARSAPNASAQELDGAVTSLVSTRLGSLLGASVPLDGVPAEVLLRWIGDVGGYERLGRDGTPHLGLVVGLRDRAAALATMAQIRSNLGRRAIPRAGGFAVARNDGRGEVRMTVGPGAVTFGLGETRRAEDPGPDGPLGRRPLFARARALLGSSFRPAAVAPAGALSRVLRGIIVEPQRRALVDLLDSAGTVAIGARAAGGVSRQRVVVSLR